MSIEKVIELIEDIQTLHKQKHLVSGESLETYYKLEELKKYVMGIDEGRQQNIGYENPQQLELPLSNISYNL